MKIITYTLLVAVVFLFGSKKDVKNYVETTLKAERFPQDTIAYMDFINYPIDPFEGLADFGDGVYRNYDFDYKDGQTMFILVTKMGKTKWESYLQKKYKNVDDDKVSSIVTDSLSKLSLKKLSEDFNIWVFFTPKQYLEYTPNLDAPYTPKIPRETTLYVYNSKNNSWDVNSIFKVDNKYDDEGKWLNYKIHEEMLEVLDPTKYKFDKYKLENIIYLDREKKKELLTKTSIEKILTRHQNSASQIIENLIFSRDKNGQLEINTDILDCISKNTTRENSTYLLALEKYGEENRYNDYWSIDERSKIKAYIFNITYPLRRKYWSDRFEEWYYGKPEVYLGDRLNWKMNNYYGLPNLEKYVDDFISTYWSDSEI